MVSCFSAVAMSNTIQATLSKSPSIAVISAPEDMDQISQEAQITVVCETETLFFFNCSSLHCNEYNICQPALIRSWH